MSKRRIKDNNPRFIDTAICNDQTYWDYIERFKKIVLSMFEWENLPTSMNQRYLEECLYYKGQASLLYDENYGFINTQCCSNGNINIYGLPSSLNCFSYGYHSDRELYTGLPSDEAREKQCVLVMNNWQMIPTAWTMELFAYRLYEAERTCDVNIKAQKTPVLILTNDKQRLALENMYEQYEGNYPAIFADKNLLTEMQVKSINTESKYIADKIMDYKKEIWNEALTFLGINSLNTEKKERLLSDEVNSNNEVINLNLQALLIPRQEACKQFNELFGLTGTDKEIKVKVRSDLYNIIKKEESVISKYDDVIEAETEEGDIDE